MNKRGAPDHDAGLQRHHLLPRQLLGRRGLLPFLDATGLNGSVFHDFRRNGLLLPASDVAALRLGLPLHRGPHRAYNALVLERVGQIEGAWSGQRRAYPESARRDAEMRLALLQRALRRRLLDPLRQRFLLSRRDPYAARVDFAELDALADMLWPATEMAL